MAVGIEEQLDEPVDERAGRDANDGAVFGQGGVDRIEGVAMSAGRGGEERFEADASAGEGRGQVRHGHPWPAGRSRMTGEGRRTR